MNLTQGFLLFGCIVGVLLFLFFVYSLCFVAARADDIQGTR